MMVVASVTPQLIQWLSNNGSCYRAYERIEFAIRLGCAHEAPVVPPASHSEDCWMLDVPVHKTGTALTKPIDAIVGEAVASWEKVRPHQPRAIDTKTDESVEFLFS